jgi:hypothetical protein
MTQLTYVSRDAPSSLSSSPVAGQPWGASSEIDLNKGVAALVDADNLATVGTKACGALWCNRWTSIILCNGVSLF